MSDTQPTTPFYSPSTDPSFQVKLNDQCGRLYFKESLELIQSTATILSRHVASLDDKKPWHTITTHTRFLMDTLLLNSESIINELRSISQQQDHETMDEITFRCGVGENGEPLECAMFENHLAILRFHNAIMSLVSNPTNALKKKLFAGSRRQKIEALAIAARQTLSELAVLASRRLAHSHNDNNDQNNKSLDVIIEEKLAALTIRETQQRNRQLNDNKNVHNKTETVPKDSKRSPEELTAKAERLLHGLGVATRCPSQAFQILIQAVKTPSSSSTIYAPAWYILGTLHQAGLGTSRNMSAALYCYRKAAGLPTGDNGITTVPVPTPRVSSDALTAIANMYLTGTIVPKDISTAADLYLQAAKLGHIGAMTGLANICLLDNNLTRAVEWYSEAAQQGCPIASVTLGNIAGQRNDWETAALAYTRAAKQGNVRGMLALGVCYESGLGVPRDLVLATYWYRESAILDSAAGMTNLGYLYWCQGKYWSAWQLWHVAASKNPTDNGSSDALWMIGCVYETGCQVGIDSISIHNQDILNNTKLLTPPTKLTGEIESERLCLTSSYLPGDPINVVVGELEHENLPFTVSQSKAMALTYFARAARAGNVPAMRKVAKYLRDGQDGVGVNLDMAREWEERADTVSRCNLLVKEVKDIHIPRLSVDVLLTYGGKRGLYE